MRPLAPLAVALSFAAVSLTGCSASAVDRADVEEQISAELAAQVGEEPDDVSCPGDLDAEVGAEMTCVLSAGGDTIDVYVVVTSVEDGTANFDIEVADEVN
ncbi:DUF4333 domain-containing protein [Nocardioides sp.]|uniref:DUF4333 domain-containing protein n=1 Tax=Nocardioides sp. TaxID=35761 RepID=UPI00356A8E26